MAPKNNKTVLVFGSSGVGKTSLLNNLTGQQHETSSAALGCTFQATYYSSVKIGATTYDFIDTTGINEGSKGTVPGYDSILNLVRLIKRNKTGFNLLIMVIKKGRITTEIENQYKLFVKHLVDGSVPAILVVTNCELDESLSTWTDDIRNREAFDKYEMKFSAIVGTSGATNTNPLMNQYFSDLRQISKTNIIKEIEEHSLKYPKCLKKNEVYERFRKVCNFIAKIFKVPRIVTEVTELLMSFGFSEEKAKELEREFIP